MTSFVNAYDVISADKRYVSLIVKKTKMNMACISSHRCLGSHVVRKNEFHLKRLISLEEINLSRQNKITAFICLINHGISPSNM